MTEGSPGQWLIHAKTEERKRFLGGLAGAECAEWHFHWRFCARPAQLPPSGDWRTWLVLAGRGFGKTRCGAEWVRMVAERDPQARIALVAASLHEARAVMVEGESGLLAIGAPWRSPRFEPSLRRLVWPNGAIAMLYSAGEPESLRGPQHSHACRAGAERGHRQRSGDRDRPPAPSGRLGRAPRSARCTRRG